MDYIAQFPLSHSIFSSSQQIFARSTNSPEPSQLVQATLSSNDTSNYSNSTPNDSSDTADIIHIQNFSPCGELIRDYDLYSLIYKISPINCWIYYKKCEDANVNKSQLLKLTESMLSRMFKDDEIGLLADLHFDLENYKNIKRANTVLPTGQIQAVMNTDARFTTRSNINGNPNALLNILQRETRLYNKAVQINDDDAPKTLTTRERTVLVCAIQNHFINNCSNKMTYEDMEALAIEIVKYFPGESQDAYFLKDDRTFYDKHGQLCTRKRATGKIASKWNNRSDKESSRSSTVTSKDVCYTIPLAAKEIENIDNLEVMRVNLIANQNYPIQVILTEWVESRPLRFKCIVENEKSPAKVFNFWPTYTHGDGHILVSDYD